MTGDFPTAVLKHGGKKFRLPTQDLSTATLTSFLGKHKAGSLKVRCST